jgi:lysophospholipase L1-like esterase
VYETLCYGDSNTWGYVPGTGGRYPTAVRWTGVLQDRLGPAFHVIEEGLNGRTTVWDDPVEGAHRNGRTYLVVLFLGVNDLKRRFGAPAADIARSAGVLVELIQHSGAGRTAATLPVLLVAPAPLGKLTLYAEMLEGGMEKSRLLAARYREVAEELGCQFLDAGGVVHSSDLDGVHLDEEQHRRLGEAVASRVKSLFPSQGRG